MSLLRRVARLPHACVGMGANSEITTDAPLPGCLMSDPRVEVTFDGGARTIAGREASGAGAALWVRDRGPPRCIAMAFLAIPATRNAQLAEAMAAYLAMRLLTSFRVCVEGWGRTARITGDNLQVIRYAAGVARFARPYL